MQERSFARKLTGTLFEKKAPNKVNAEMTSNLDELFKNSDGSAYVSELKKAIFHIERLTPKEIPTPFRGTCIELNHSEDFFVFGSNEGRIAKIDTVSKEITQEIMQEGGNIYSIAIYSNDCYMLSAGKDGIIRKFLFSDLTLDRLFIGHSKEVNKIVLSVDESKIFSASDDCTVREWDDLKSSNRILYSHEKPVLSLDRSSDSTFLVSGGADKKLILFNLKSSEIIFTFSEFASPVWAVRISPTSKLLAAGDSNAVIKIWSVENLNLLKTLTGHLKRVSHLEFCKNETALVSSSNDQTLRIWSIDKEKNEIVLTGHTDWVKHFRVSRDNKFIYSIAENFKILSWYFPKFDSSCRIKNHNSKIISSFVLAKNKTRPEDLLFSADCKTVNVWIIENRTVYRTFNTPFEINAICPNQKTGLVLLALANKEVISWNVEDLKSKFLFRHESTVRVLKISPEGRFLIVGDSNFRVTVFNAKSYEKVCVNRRHNSAVDALAFQMMTNGMTGKIFSGGADCKIFVYNVEKNFKSKKFGNHLDGITCLEFSDGCGLLVSGDEAGCVKIWQITSKKCIKVLENHTDRITGFHFTNNLKYLWIGSVDESLSLLSLVNYTQVTKIKTRGPVHNFGVNSEETDLLIAEGDSLYFFPNILTQTQFYIYGPGEDFYSFMKYIMEMCEGNEQVHIPEMNNFIILPFEFNALHLYAYFNLPLHLKQAMNSLSPFYSSKSNISPLHIAVERNFRDCINEIVRCIRVRIEEDPYTVFYLEDQIIKLNRLGFRGLDELYEMILFRVSDKKLPKFVPENTELPIFKLSDKLGPQSKEFFGNVENSNSGICIRFFQSALKVEMAIGSQESLDFLESLVECPNSNVFTTQFIREIILYKWKYVKWVLLPQAFGYFLYTLILSYYLIVDYGENSPFLVVLIFALNVFLTLYEVYQMILTGWSYFTDTWNYIDIIRFSICFSYCITYWIDSSMQQTIQSEEDKLRQKYIKQSLVVLTFFTMLRGISYFRLFDKTRYMINLLKEVFSDMTSFIILLTYSTYSFALIYYIMVNNIKSSEGSETKPFAEFVAEAYLLNLGDFDTEGYGAFEWMIFFFASVINPLIMLNLLISLMGDTFGRVKEEQEIADMKELAQMVLEGEFLLYCKRKSECKKFIQICSVEEVVAGFSTPMDRVDKLKRRIKGIQNNLNAKHEETRSEIKNSIGGVSSKLDEMSTLIEQINFNQDS